jgi:predicted small lipoprotein YifL
MTRKTPLLALLLLAAAATGLTGCGRKGPPERPETAQAEDYEPAPDATVRGPRKPFILDGLLR